MKDKLHNQIDYQTSPIEEVWKEDLKWIKDRKQTLEEEGRLCKSTGMEILAEFQFKGCYPAVLNQLNSLIKETEENPYTEEDRERVSTRRSRYDEYWLYKEDMYADVITESIREHRKKPKDGMSQFEVNELVDAHIRHIVDIVNAKMVRDNTIHDKKECICYCND